MIKRILRRFFRKYMPKEQIWRDEEQIWRDKTGDRYLMWNVKDLIEEPKPKYVRSYPNRDWKWIDKDGNLYVFKEEK